MQLEEIGGKNMAELQGIGGDGGIGQRFASGGENCLKTAANPAPGQIQERFTAFERIARSSAKGESA